MKKLLIISSFLAIACTCCAQLTINLVLNTKPPAIISQWASTAGTVTLIVNNQQAPRRAKIKVTITTVSGDAVATTDLTSATIFLFNDGNTILNTTSVFPFELQRFVGKYQNTINKTGALPADNYMFCVELIDPNSAGAVAAKQCRNFIVANTQLPVLMMPYNEQLLDQRKANTAIIFRWTPLTPAQQSSINYRLQVFEILPGQQPMQALRANQPIVDRVITNTTQFIWQPQGILHAYAVSDTTTDSTNSSVQITDKMKSNKIFPSNSQKISKYIWTIQTTNSQGVPYNQTDGSGEGRSEPKIFIVQ